MNNERDVSYIRVNIELTSACDHKAKIDFVFPMDFDMVNDDTIEKVSCMVVGIINGFDWTVPENCCNY